MPSAGAPATAGTASAGAPLMDTGGGTDVGGTNAGGAPTGGSGVVVIPIGSGGTSGTAGSAPTAPTGVELDRSEWRVSASNTYYPNTMAENAIDSDPQSCWASGTPQAPGMWFLVDLHEVQTFFRVDVATLPGSTDYGRHLKLSGSVDGGKFVPLRTDIAGAHNLQIGFDEAQSARYLKLEITSDAGGLWWRIDDLHVMQ